MNKLDFLCSYYQKKFFWDFEKIEKCAKEIPNKSLSESILSALTKNKHWGSEINLNDFFNFDLNSRWYSARDRQEFHQFLSLLPQVPWVVYDYMFAEEEQSNLSSEKVLRAISHLWPNVKVDEDVIGALSEIDVSIDCPHFFKTEDEPECYGDCDECWTKATEKYLKPIVERQTPGI